MKPKTDLKFSSHIYENTRIFKLLHFSAFYNFQISQVLRMQKHQCNCSNNLLVFKTLTKLFFHLIASFSSKTIKKKLKKDLFKL